MIQEENEQSSRLVALEDLDKHYIFEIDRPIRDLQIKDTEGHPQRELDAVPMKQASLEYILRSIGKPLEISINKVYDFLEMISKTALADPSFK